MAVSERDFSAYASPYDYTRLLKKEAALPEGRRPYILARFALSQYSEREFADDACEALGTLYSAHNKDVLEPPLSQDLYKEIEVFMNDQHNMGGRSAAFILAWAVDHGERPVHG